MALRLNQFLNIFRISSPQRLVPGSVRTLTTCLTGHNFGGLSFPKGNTNAFLNTKLPLLNPTCGNKRGIDYQPNNNKRIKTHGWKTKMQTTNGKITIIKRMMKGVSRRRLTP